MTRTYDLGSAFKTAMEKFSIWMASGTILFQSWHFLKDGIAYVNEYNKALTELSVVYMQTQNQVEKLGEKLHNLSIEMGVSTQEVAKGAVEFARQGLSEAESIKRMETAMKYAKISNLDFSTSARILTATVNSMGISAERAADVFSYMGDATATGADEIGMAFQRMGGTIGSTDIEFEKAASWIAVISSKTRESSYTIGNSIKSIIARFQQLKEQGFSEEDGTQVNQVAKALAEVGIQLIDSQGQFRNFGIVMDELGEKWKTLDNRHRAYLSTVIGGSYQQARFLNMMEGHDEALKLYEESLNQAGIANKKFDLVQQGTEAQLIKMKNTFEGVWLNTFSSQGIRNAIAILTGVGNAINHIIETIGFLPPVIIASTLAIVAFNNNMRTTLILNGTQFIGLLKQQIALWMQNSNAIARNAIGASLATVAFNGLKLSLAGLNTALITTGRFFAGALIPIAIITAVTYGITKLGEVVWDLSHKTENAKEEFNKLKDELKSLNSETTEVNSLIKSYEELSGGLAKTKEEKDKLASVTQRLSELYPEAIINYDLEGKAVEANIKLVKELLKVKEQEREDKKNNLKNTFYDIGEDTFDNLLKNRDKIKKANEELNSLLSLKNNRSDLDKTFLNVEESVLFGDTEDEKISELRNNISKFTDESRKDFEILTSQIQATYSEFDNFKNLDSSSLNLFIRDVLNNVDGANINNIKEFMDYISKTELPNVFADYNKGLEDYKKGSIEYDVLVKKQEISIALLEKVFKDLGITVPDVLNKIKEDLLELPDINKSLDSFTDFDSAVKSLTDTYEKSLDEINEYQQLLSDVTEGNDINFESVKKLIEVNPKLITAIKNENGQMTISADALRMLIKERKLEHKTAIESQIEKTKIINKATLDRIKSYGIEIEQIHNLADAEAAVIEMGNNMASNVGKMTPEEEKQAVADLSRSRAEIEKNKQEIEEYKKLSKELIDSMGSPNFGITKDSKDTASAKTAESLAWEEVTNQIKKYDNALKSLEDATDNQVKGSKDRRDALHAENLKIKEQIDYLKQQRGELDATDTSNNNSNTYTPTSTGKAKGVVDIAMGSLGTPYKWGGNDLHIGVDCSGLVQQTYEEVGVSVPRVAQDQYNQAPIKLTKQQLQPGDLVFFGNSSKNIHHVGIYAGDGKMIEAPHTGAKVRTASIDGRDFYAGGRYPGINNATAVSSSSKSELSYQKILEDRVKHQEEINAKILELEKQFAQNSKEWYTDLWQESDNIISEFEQRNNFSKSISDGMSKSSPEYRNEIEVQRNNTIGVQKQLAEQGKQMDQAIENMKKGIEDGTFKDKEFLEQTIEKRKALSAEWWNKQNEINNANSNILTSKLDENNLSITEYNNTIELSKSKLESLISTSSEYRNELTLQNTALNNILSAKKANIAILTTEINSGKLQGQELIDRKQQLAELNNEYINLNNTISDNNLQIIQSQFDVFDKELTPLIRKLSNLKFNFDLLGDSDFDTKLELINSQIKASEKLHRQYIKELNEISRIHTTDPEKIKYYAERMLYLKDAIRENTQANIEYQKQLNQIKLDKLADQTDSAIQAVNDKIAAADHTLDMLKDGKIANIGVTTAYTIDEDSLKKSKKVKSDAEKYSIDIDEEYADDKDNIEKQIGEQTIENQTAQQTQETEQLVAHLENLKKLFLDYQQFLLNINSVLANPNLTAEQKMADINKLINNENEKQEERKESYNKFNEDIANLQKDSQDKQLSDTKDNIENTENTTTDHLTNQNTAYQDGFTTIIKTVTDGMEQIAEIIEGIIKSINVGSSSSRDSEDHTGSANNYGEYASGTDSHPGGLAVTSEKGREIIIYPNGRVAISGDKGAELVNLPPGTKVIPNKETEEILRGDKAIPIPGYENGIGNVKTVPSYASGTDYDSMTPEEIASLMYQIKIDAISEGIKVANESMEKWVKEREKHAVDSDEYKEANEQARNYYELILAYESKLKAAIKERFEYEFELIKEKIEKVKELYEVEKNL